MTKDTLKMKCRKDEQSFLPGIQNTVQNTNIEPVPVAQKRVKNRTKERYLKCHIL